jgi:hypothetical protein
MDASANQKGNTTGVCSSVMHDAGGPDGRRFKTTICGDWQRRKQQAFSFRLPRGRSRRSNAL